MFEAPPVPKENCDVVGAAGFELKLGNDEAFDGGSDEPKVGGGGFATVVAPPNVNGDASEAGLLLLLVTEIAVLLPNLKTSLLLEPVELPNEKLFVGG